MANSTSILDYLGRGTHAARPVSPPIASGALAAYYETDTGHTFVWSGSAWVQVDGTAGSTTLAGDTDVLISSPANGQVLTYNSSASKWENQTPSSGSSTLASDTDVAISSPTNGQVLTYNSGTSKWSNATPGIAYPAAGYDAAILADSPRTFFKCDDLHTASTMADAVGGATLTLNGNTRCGERGLVPDGSGSVFALGRNTNADFVSFLASAFLPSVSGSFSVELWAMADYWGSVNVLFDSDPSHHLLLYAGANGASAMWLNNGGTTFAPAINYPIGTPFHLVYTWDGTNSTLYYNGFVIYQHATSPGFPTSGSGQLFSGSNALNDPCSAWISKLAAYSTALTAAQVLAHYAAGVPLL